RVVSLLASGTEITCAVGDGHSLVGRSHECDNPEWVRRLPVCTKPTFDTTGSSRDIDREVRRRFKAGEGLYSIDAELINARRPNLLITQSHCEVCAVTPGDVTRRAGAVVTDQVLALSAGSVAGIYDDVRAVAHALGRGPAGDSLIAEMRRRINVVTTAVRS